MKKKTLLNLIAMMLVASVFLSGCGASDDKETDKKSSSGSTKETFVYAIDGDPGNSINTITTSDRYGLMAVKAMYSPLYMYNGPDDVEYFLAESMTPSSDFMTYTAKLRQDVKWHDGEPFTADDVVFTYEQMMKVENGGWAYGQLIFDDQPVQVTKVDDYTVEFKLPEPSMSAMESFSNIFIMPKHIYEGETNFANSEKNASPVGTGPYKFDSYKAGDSLTMTKNEDYFLGEPKIPTVVYKIMQDPNTAMLALQSGEVDALNVLPKDAEKLKDDENIQIESYTEGRIGYLGFNMASPAVQDQAVREAVAYGINRDDVNKAAYTSEEYYTTAYSFLPSTATYQTNDVNKREHDVKKAKELLAGEKPTLKLAYTSSRPDQVQQAAVIQQDLKEVGITVELMAMEGPALINQLSSGEAEFDMFLNGYVMGIDPDIFNPLFVTDGSANYFNYSNPEVDALFTKGRTESDEKAREQIYEDVQKMVIEDCAIIPLVENKRVMGFNKDLAGIEDAGLVPVYTFEDMSKLYYK